ncbi:MAG TPA: hypothetical protein RMH85_33480 [Polyangiaceae bacterium LLY-WYZ-15_(1-7)]|nr:hypothetical protein [Sandaracinus sp.]HJL06722.1 hypothetical protein [Polyangiaceae bacterium LLY-WYZ-15_(1-7)]MBJ72669.1 hypothetical protein [Sandaracinus sp.]HJL13443.1 hypothetical protein [Polyangiaceae bacterium LLY-WYZ-15_(1-7)]HJL26371.1 hypothetical protein [Polyangiaceae bacterium LLY-WYZ-15_(1-7)]
MSASSSWPRRGLPSVALLALAALAATPRPSRADAPLAYAVEAELDADGALRGTATIDVRVEGGDGLRLWVYADRLAVAPEAIDEQRARWIYPREIDTSAPEVEVRAGGRQLDIAWEREPVGEPRGRDTRGADLRVPLPDGRHRIEVRFAYRLPERFGRLGRVGDRLTLTGPWYPLVVGADGATRFDAPHRVGLGVPEGWESAAQDVVEGRIARTRRGRFVPIVLAPDQHVRERDLPGGWGLRVVSPTPLYRPPGPDAEGIFRLHDIARVDVVGEVARVAADVVETLRLVEVPVRPLTFDVVLVPSRTELAATAPGRVLVSDRLYEVFPIEQVQAFHDRALRRALFRRALEPLVDALEAPADRDWAEDLRAVLLTDLDEVRRQGRLTTARDLIGWAGFHPAIDQLLYAPQVAFVDVYFGAVAEPDLFRDAPERARAPTARGRRLVESARDVLEEEAFQRFSRELVAARRPARAIAADLDADRGPEAPAIAARIDGWLASPGTAVNYVLEDVRSTETEAGWRHVVRVRRVGDRRVEPVEVRLTSREGETRTETWDGEGEVGELVFETAGAVRDVDVDPRSRLVQSPRAADGHPRRDDSLRLPWRPPILQGFNFAVGATEGAFIGLLDFALRRRWDLENTVALRLDTGPRSTGGLLRYVRGVGRKRDTNNRIGFLSTGLELDRLRSGFAGSDEGVGGWRTALVFVGGYSTLRYFLDPREGSSLVGSVRAGLVFRDDGSRSWTLSPALRGNVTVPVGLRTALVFVGGASVALGQPLASERPGLGGRFLLRGYQNAEVVGRGRVYGVVEARFTPTAFADLNVNVVHLAWIREIQLALFAGGGAVFDADDGRDVAPGAEVGGGLRVHFEYGGVQPGVLALDLAVPLVRTAEARRTLSPVTTILAFEQYF